MMHTQAPVTYRNVAAQKITSLNVSRMTPKSHLFHTCHSDFLILTAKVASRLPSPDE
jgi:hypothetical protein